MPDKDLDGRVVVITGASSGFGKGVARALAERGAWLALAARREHLLHELADECEMVGGRALPVPTDVGREADVERLARETMGEFGRIDCWINDAGVGAIGRFEETPIQDHIRIVDTNLLGPIFGSYFALRQFRRQGEGTLINVASALGKLPAPYYATYTAAKHGVVGLSAALRQELRENNLADRIHICTVMPMAMDTPFFEHSANYTGRESTPIPPLYDPEKVIDTIVKLVTDPEDEVIVGGAGKLMNALHNVAPKLTERMLGRQTHAAQIDKARPAPITRGGVQQPSEEGAAVRGSLPTTHGKSSNGHTRSNGRKSAPKRRGDDDRP